MRRGENRGTVMWLVLCFPYGLIRMWRASCRWHVAIKSLVTASVAALICVIALWPAPKQVYGSTVTLVGKEQNVAVFGPELPEGYDSALYPPSPTADNLFAEEVVDDTVFYYVNGKGNSFYHTKDCKYAYESSLPYTLYEAYLLGYTTPCTICKPPLYEPKN